MIIINPSITIEELDNQQSISLVKDDSNIGISEKDVSVWIPLEIFSSPSMPDECNEENESPGLL